MKVQTPWHYLCYLLANTIPAKIALGEGAMLKLLIVCFVFLSSMCFAQVSPISKLLSATVRTFTPTQYFGYYYQDISDPQTFTPYQGCLTFTILAFNDSDCTSSGQGSHNFAIFLQQVPNRAPVYWIAGQDPSACAFDGDCNLTIVKVRRMPLSD